MHSGCFSACGAAYSRVHTAACAHVQGQLMHGLFWPHVPRACACARGCRTLARVSPARVPRTRTRLAGTRCLINLATADRFGQQCLRQTPLNHITPLGGEQCRRFAGDNPLCTAIAPLLKRLQLPGTKCNTAASDLATASIREHTPASQLCIRHPSESGVFSILKYGCASICNQRVRSQRNKDTAEAIGRGLRLIPSTYKLCAFHARSRKHSTSYSLFFGLQRLGALCVVIPFMYSEQEMESARRTRAEQLMAT
eukprot:6189568-Pleurochrysis_carterae.AAC.1